MNRRIVIIQGHPDPAGNHFGHALADIIGLVEGNNNHRSRWLEKMQSLGRDSR